MRALHSILVTGVTAAMLVSPALANAQFAFGLAPAPAPEYRLTPQHYHHPHRHHDRFGTGYSLAPRRIFLPPGSLVPAYGYGANINPAPVGPSPWPSQYMRLGGAPAFVRPPTQAFPTLGPNMIQPTRFVYSPPNGLYGSGLSNPSWGYRPDYAMVRAPMPIASPHQVAIAQPPPLPIGPGAQPPFPGYLTGQQIASQCGGGASTGQTLLGVAAGALLGGAIGGFRPAPMIVGGIAGGVFSQIFGANSCGPNQVAFVNNLGPYLDGMPIGNNAYFSGNDRCFNYGGVGGCPLSNGYYRPDLYGNRYKCGTFWVGDYGQPRIITACRMGADVRLWNGGNVMTNPAWVRGGWATRPSPPPVVVRYLNVPRPLPPMPRPGNGVGAPPTRPFPGPSSGTVVSNGQRPPPYLRPVNAPSTR